MRIFYPFLVTRVRDCVVNQVGRLNCDVSSVQMDWNFDYAFRKAHNRIYILYLAIKN